MKIPPVEAEIQPKWYIALQVKYSELLTDRILFASLVKISHGVPDVNFYENLPSGCRDSAEMVHCSLSKVPLIFNGLQPNLRRPQEHIALSTWG
jgi:hypothetical protein